MAESSKNSYNPTLEEIEELFNDAGLEDDFQTFKCIFKKIKTDTQSLIKNNCKIGDLYNKYKLKTTEEKDAFAKYRALLRYHDIKQRPMIDFSNKEAEAIKDEINSFSRDQICQLFQQVIEDDSCSQCIEWFLIIEGESCNGSTLFTMDKADLEKLLKKMKLTSGQKSRFKNLAKNYKKKSDKSAKVAHVKLQDAIAGVVAGNGKVNARRIYLPAQTANKKSLKGKDSDNESDSLSSGSSSDSD